MGRYLHFGAGPNQLPEPWENLNAEHDIRKRLKFEDGCASAIHCEHVIEHVGLVHGLAFVRECFRVLEPGGRLRLVFPDATRFLALELGRRGPVFGSAVALGFIKSAASYAAWLTRRHPEVDNDPRKSVEKLLTGWGHQTPWTIELAQVAAMLAGFAQAEPSQYGAAPEDGHHKDVGFEWAAMESSAVECFK